jgi:hypothetical protein
MCNSRLTLPTYLHSLANSVHAAPADSSAFLEQEGISFGLFLLIGGLNNVLPCTESYGFTESQVAFYSHGLVIWIGSSTSWKQQSILQ